MRIRPIYLLAALLWGGMSAAQHSIRLTPQFVPQQTFRYRFDYRVEREGQTSGVLENPQAPRKIEISASVILRIDILGVEQDASRGPTARLRGTYEKVSSTTQADVYDRDLAEGDEQRRGLEGLSLEFTVDSEGNISNLTGLEKLFPEQSSTAAAWLGQFALGPAPRQAIAPGKSWSVERPLPSAPLAGLVWHGESTYLRNEPCHLAQLTAEGKREPSPVQEECAVVLTRFEVSQKKVPKDPTPEEFRRRGLRTAGKYTGSGESLAYVSLQNGWVVSLTQNMSEETDLTVRAPEQGSEVRYSGRARSTSQITLVLPSAAVAP